MTRRNVMKKRRKELAVVVSQEQLADGIYSMWIQAESAPDAVPGQFISMYTMDSGKLLPRPISICEIDKAGAALRVVYRVTGEKTGTEQFSKLSAGDSIPIIGPLGNGFPMEKAAGKKAFLIGGGIGVPPILELSKELECDKKQIVVGYRDAHTFLREEFERNGEVYISTEDGSVGTKGMYWMPLPDMRLPRILSMPAGLGLCCARSRNMLVEITLYAIYLWRRGWRAGSAPVLDVSVRRRSGTATAMCITDGSARTVRYSCRRRWRSDEYEG